MKYRITQAEYDNIEYLARCAISAYTQKDAKYYIDRLKFVANSCDYAGSVRNIIGELCSSVTNAAGSVADKSRKAYFVEMDLSKLKGFIEE